MNKLCGLSLLLALFTAGCGKKKADVKKNDVKKIASLDKDLTFFTSDKEELVENDPIDEFAFIDDEDIAGVNELVVTAEESQNPSQQKLQALTSAVAGENELLVTADEASLVEELGFKRVQFDFNQNSIRKDQAPVIDADVKAAKEAVKQGKTVAIQGHTCQIGSAGYNISLSQQRAETVKQKIVAAGVPSEHIKTVGYGYEQPLVWSDATDRTEKIKELSPNRRAELFVN